MKDLNSVMLIGRLVRNVDLKYLQSGMAVGSGSLAVNSTRKENGQYVDDVSFFDFELWGKQAESLKVYLDKGARVALQGRLKQEHWKDSTGGSRSRVKVIVENVQLLGNAQKKAKRENVDFFPQALSSEPQEPVETVRALQDAGLVEDIPF